MLRAYAFVAALLLALALGPLGEGGPPSTAAFSGPSAGEWPRATPAEQGLQATPLHNAVALIEAGAFGAIDSLLVARHGALVLERYFNGYGPEQIHRMYSVTKSVTSLLVGIAIERGFIDGTERTLLSFFPEYESIDNLDARKLSVTLDDLLTMRAGFRWDEWSRPYTHPDNPTTALVESADWIEFMLDLPMAAEPGTRFVYNSGVSVLLSGIVRNATGQNVREFALEHLFGPLGIEQFAWEEGPHDVYNTGWGLFLRPLDMLKLGQLVLDGGLWQDERIVSQDWIDRSTRPYVRRSPNLAYGYQWWLKPLEDLSVPNAALYAGGWGGQFIYVLPELDALVVMTASNYGGAPRSPHDLVYDFVLPAVRDRMGAEAPVGAP